MQENINKILKIIYVFLIFLFFIAVAFFKPINTPNTKDFKNINQIRNLSIYTLDEDGKYIFSVVASAPAIMYTQKPVFVDVDLSNIDDLKNKSFAIQSAYMDFVCYVDDEIIYEQMNSKNNIINSSGSDSYYIIDFPNNILEQKLTIKFIPTSPHIEKYTLNKIEVGYRSNFLTYILTHELVSIVISFILFILSIILFFVFITMFVRFKIQDKRLVNIAILSFCFAIFSFVSYKFTNYIFSQYMILLYFFKYTALLYMPICIINLMDDLIDDRFKKISFVFTSILNISCISQILLTYFKILEFKEMLTISALLIITFITLELIFVLLSNRAKQKIKLIISIVPILSLFTISIMTYIMLGKFEINYIILFVALLFISDQIHYGIKSYVSLMSEHEKTKKYKSLISYDTLTLLGSRRSFEDNINNIKDNPSDTTIIVADLNNLKWVNDKMGHAYGDIFIKEASVFLRDNFKDAKIYRIGGDEFVVICGYILSDGDFEIIKNKKLYIKNISEKIDTSIAFGKCDYLKEGSLSIDEAFKLADNNMYKNKNMYKKDKFYYR